MKWIIGVALTIVSPLIISLIILYLLVYRLPMTAYETAHAIYELYTNKKHDGIGWYK